MEPSPEAAHELFPTSRAIREELQIGRKAFIDQVEKAVLGGSSILLLEDRRQGKSSVARAVADRIRDREPPKDLALMVDLSDGANSSSRLTERLLDEAKEQRALKVTARTRLAASEAAAKAGRRAKRHARPLAEAAAGIGGEEEAAVATAIAEMLTPETSTSFRTLLESLDRFGREQGVRIVIFIDEIQALADWEDADEVQDAIATVAGRPGARLAFILAGSERTAVEKMFEPGGPLDYFGRRLELPEISDEEWKRGLKKRFNHLHLEIADAQLKEIIVGGDGHPLKTMQICGHIIDIVAGDEITQSTVRQAVRLMLKHPAWQKRRRS